MFLSKIEHEAFMRGKVAGLIPEETAVPNNETEIDHLIFNIGFLHCRKFAYRDLSSRLKIMTVSAFTKEHLENIIHNLPVIKPDEVFHVTDFQQEEYPSSVCIASLSMTVHKLVSEERHNNVFSILNTYCTFYSAACFL